MKIYPNKTTVVATKVVNPITDIPLSYLDTDSKKCRVTNNTEEKMKIKSVKEILPYDAVSDTFCLFDSFGNIIPYEEMIRNFVRQGDDYFYLPVDSITFSPCRFSYSVTVKKTMSYKSNMPYNLKAVCVNNKTLARNLMPIFGDAPKRLVSPGNIYVNNGDLSLDSLISMNIKDKDLTFFVLKDLFTCMEEDMFTGDMIEEVFDKNVYLNNFNSNLVLFMKDEYAIDLSNEDNSIDEKTERVKLYKNKEKATFNITKSDVYDKVSITTDKVFKIPKIEKDSNIKYINIFGESSTAPILIEEHIDKGFVIYMTEEISKDIKSYSKLMYEIIMRIYLNAYLTSENINEWITDSVPDFVVTNNKLVKKDKFTSRTELHKIFDLGKNEVIMRKVNIDKDLYPFASFDKMESSFLIFTKDISGDNSKFSDPKKPDEHISIYTQNNNIIYYKNFLYKITDSIDERMNIKIMDREIILDLKSYKNSDYGIYIKQNINELKIPIVYFENNEELQITKEDFYLVAKKNESASYYDIVNKKKYKDSDGIILTTINISQESSDRIIYDMRRRGGGLKEEDADNYNCFDIAHIHGRPYRKAGASIITLPLYLKDHKEIIESTIKQYMVAEEFPIILFE